MTATGPIVNRGQRLCMLTGDRLLAVDPPKARGADTKVQRDRMGRLEGSPDSRPLAARSIHGVHARASSRDLNRVSSSTVRLWKAAGGSREPVISTWTVYLVLPSSDDENTSRSRT